MRQNFSFLFIVLLLAGACDMKNENQKFTIDSNAIGKPLIKDRIKILTPEIMWCFGRIGDLSLSPDKNRLAFGIKYYDISANKGNNDLYIIDLNDFSIKQITRSAESESNLAWRPDGKKICFLYPDDSGKQLWEMDPDGTDRKRITTIQGGITGFKYSPDQSRIVFSAEVKLNDSRSAIYNDLPKAKAYIEEDLMFRHWDTWTESNSHLFIAGYQDQSVSNAKDIMENEPYDSPNKPFGGMEQIAWSPDSKLLVYTCVKKLGKEYSESTNSDLYQYDVLTGHTQNLTQGMMGYDKNPVFSPDGKYLAWESMEHDGFESDKNRLFIKSIETNEKKDCSYAFDYNVNGITWDQNSQRIFFTSDISGRVQICMYDIQPDTFKIITRGNYNFQSLHISGKSILTTRMSMSMPPEIFMIDLNKGTEKQITQINKDILDKLDMGEVEERHVKTSDGKDMMVWVIYPPDFDAKKKYPVLLYCQGGPQSAVSQYFSYRWNFQLMAARGYIVVAPNRRGLPGFGQEWNRQISGDYGGQNMKDYLSAVDAISKEPFVDKNRLGAIGASYGGFSVYWLAGHHQGRFKVFIAHDGMFNLESQYLETDEMWFVNWDFGGPYWDKENAVAQNTYKNSPHLFVDKWDTPILIFHGEKDYRISYTQGLQAFTAARLRGIPAKYVHFPEENHWVLSPQNSILWQREFFGWLEKWLGENP